MKGHQATRQHSVTRLIERLIHDTRGFVDDVLDRAKELVTFVMSAVIHAVGKDEDETVPLAGVAELQAAMAELTAKVNQLELQLSS